MHAMAADTTASMIEYAIAVGGQAKLKFALTSEV
jgi:hypothetical protein